MTCNNFLRSPWKLPSTWVPAFIFGLGVLLLLPSIWSESSVTGMDEYWLSFRTPMEMMDRGDWLTPWLNGEPRLRKPPLLYWAILANYKLFGVHLASARIWGVLSGAGLAVCACLLSRELFGKDGLLAGLLAIATMGVAVEGRRAMLDLPLAFFSTMAVLCWVNWQRRSARQSSAEAPSKANAPLAPLLFGAIFLGLSFLTKGPVGFLFFIAGVIACVLAFRLASLLARNWWQLVLAGLVLAGVCLPWPLAMHHLWSEQFGKIMGEELAARQFGHWTPGSPLSAWSGALGLILPWTPLMVAAVWTQFRQKSSQFRPEKHFLIGWFVLSAAPFFFMKSFERYMLALVPAQIVLCAQWLEENQSRSREVILKVCVVLLVLIAALICAFAAWFKLAVWAVLVALLLAGIVLLLAFRSAHPHWVVSASALLFTVVLGGVYPRFGINALPENLSPELASYQSIKLFDSEEPSLISMRLRRSVQSVTARQWLESSSLASPQIIFVDRQHGEAFFAGIQKHALDAVEKGHFRSFFSRGAWIRFARADAKWADWKTAFRERSLEGLKPEFHYYLVSAGVNGIGASK